MAEEFWLNDCAGVIITTLVNEEMHKKERQQVELHILK